MGIHPFTYNSLLILKGKQKLALLLFYNPRLYLDVFNCFEPLSVREPMSVFWTNC